MLVVPCPFVIEAPAGTPQLYVVAPATALIEYTSPVAFSQGDVLPVIAPGVAGREVKVTPFVL
jgi:hypothetical protein